MIRQWHCHKWFWFILGIVLGILRLWGNTLASFPSKYRLTIECAEEGVILNPAQGSYEFFSDQPIKVSVRIQDPVMVFSSWQVIGKAKVEDALALETTVKLLGDATLIPKLTKIVDVQVMDETLLGVIIHDGEVKFRDNGKGKTAFLMGHDPENNLVVRYDPPLQIQKVSQVQYWRLTSQNDSNYQGKGLPPKNCFRKSKLNGMAEFHWRGGSPTQGGDFEYQCTQSHTIFLTLPYPLKKGSRYTLWMDANLKGKPFQISFIYDPFLCRSEAIHLNLVGYLPIGIKSADLYLWMGDGKGRDYRPFEESPVFLYNVDTKQMQQVGKVRFGRKNAPELNNYWMLMSDIWHVDFSGVDRKGRYRLVIDRVGCSQDFEIHPLVYREPFRVVNLGYFYMRLGADHPEMIPPPRWPLMIPGREPPHGTKVLLTDLHPYHPAWKEGGVDPWDNPALFARYIKKERPENPNVWGGYSDAADLDKRLDNTLSVYDILLAYILTKGILDDDDFGIPESGNGIPDVIDTARFEVDFWLRLRDGEGYSEGITDPTRSPEGIRYQSAATPMAAWANAANCAMLAYAFRIAGQSSWEKYYLKEAIKAFHHGQSYPEGDQLLEYTVSGVIRGRDLKSLAAIFLYNLTGEKDWEQVFLKTLDFFSPFHDQVIDRGVYQIYSYVGYLLSPYPVSRPEIRGKMKAKILKQAIEKEVNYTMIRPSRRGTCEIDGYFHPIQNMHRSIVAHGISDEEEVKNKILNALILEADWGLGRNPLNMIFMTTATTPLARKRSIENIYTTGRNDGVPGLHPGHTPYLNMDDWAPPMVMGRPRWLMQRCYPSDIQLWPRGELYFNTRYVWAHSEFTPQQTMRGKYLLYGYLYALGKQIHCKSKKF